MIIFLTTRVSSDVFKFYVQLTVIMTFILSNQNLEQHDTY